MKILDVNGFNDQSTLKCMTLESITEMEVFLNENWNAISSIFAGTFYESMKPFKFLPGHRALLKKISHHIQENRMKIEKKIDTRSSLNRFSQILKCLIEDAELNLDRAPKTYRYHEIIRSYATYLYLMCGKAAYEVLSANLPIPQASTIRKYFLEDKSVK